MNLPMALTGFCGTPALSCLVGRIMVDYSIITELALNCKITLESIFNSAMQLRFSFYYQIPLYHVTKT